MRWRRAVAMALRWSWLPVLVAAAVVSLPAVFPQHDSFARALYDVQHQNSSVVYLEKLDPGRRTAEYASSGRPTG
jgi:hypothetical protein